jgi:hypothetical protein
MRPAAWLAVLMPALPAAEAHAAPRLKAFSSCARLLSYARAEARRAHGSVGVVRGAAERGVTERQLDTLQPVGSAPF